MTNQIDFGVFDHIEHLPGVPLGQLYKERLLQLEALDRAEALWLAAAGKLEAAEA